MGALEDYLSKLDGDQPKSSVAGPKGMLPAWETNQGSDAMAAYMKSLPGGDLSGNGQPQTGEPTMRMQSWYTGQNTQGTQNGWDTDFQQVFQKGLTKAYQEGDPYGYFAKENATGVVTWDNARGRDATYEFGDVVVDGAKVGNVYKDFDRHTANVMMGEYLIETGARKAQLNDNGEPEKIAKAWDDELNALRGKATESAQMFEKAKTFEGNVKSELEQDSDKDRAAIVGGAFVGGAALGGGIGSLFPVVGTAIGAGVGGTISAIGAWLNSDSLAYQLERSQEQYRIAAAEGAGIQAALSGIAQNTMSIGLSPFQNLLQGTYDLMGDGGVTGGTIGGEFYETNSEGERTAGAAWQIADFGALIADSAVQLASPLGKSVYSAQMSTQIAAGTLGLLPGVGSWDATRLEQDNVWTSREYNPETGKFEESFDLGNALAGIGNVGIDVVQLGGISALARGSDQLAARVAGQSGVEATGAAARFTKFNPLSKIGDTLEKANLDSVQRAALRNGGRIEVQSGYKFVIDAEGQIVGKNRSWLKLGEEHGTKARASLAMLAPSEGLQALSAKMLARRDAARRSGAVAAEDLYQAASDLAMGQRGITAMLVNAVGEGQEEVAQSLLEPWSQDHKVDAEQVLRAGLAGAASGFGMTFGARLGRPNQDLQMYAVARAAHFAQSGGAELKYSDWQEMDNLSKRNMVKSASALTKSVTDASFAKIESDRIRGTIGSTVEAAHLEDYWREETEAALANGTAATDQASPIVMHESSTFRPEAISTSHTQLLESQKDRSIGATTQLKALDDKIREAEAAVKAAPADTNLADRLAQMQSDHASLTELLNASRTIERTLADYVTRIDELIAVEDMPAAELVIDELNDMLEAMYDMSDNTYDLVMKDGTTRSVTLTDATQFAFAKAVSRLMTRDPADSKGSWQQLMPQVNKTWSKRRVDGLYGVSQIILNSIRGDYDGDKMRKLQQVVVEDQDFRNIRSGANVLGVNTMPEIASTKFEKQLVTLVMRAWGSSNGPLSQAALKVAQDIEASLKTRYGTLVDPAVLSEVNEATIEALKTGGDARETVLNLMSMRAGGVLQSMGLGHEWTPGSPKLSNEMYWMANMVTQHLQEFQSAYAEHTPVKGDVIPPNKVVVPAKTSTETRARRAKRAGTEGTEMWNVLPGDNKFRMFQKLHYTLLESTEKGVGFAEGREDFQRVVQFYEQLSQGVLEQKLDRHLSPSDQIIGRVMSWLEAATSDPAELKRLGLSEQAEMALLANMAVPQMVYATDANGSRHLKFTGKTVSHAQHLLYISLELFRQEHRQVWDKDTDLRAAYNNLMSLTKPQTQGDESSFPGNAEAAFVRVFDSVRLYDLVGTDAVSLGVQRTVGQVYRELRAQAPEARKEQKYALRTGVYADAKKGWTIPFDAKKLEKGSSTATKAAAYKSVVDSVFSAADSSLSMNMTGPDRGKVHGRDAKKSQDRGKAIRDAYTEVQALLRKLAPRTGGYTAADISRIANANPEFGAALLKTIPRQAMPWVARMDDLGRPVFASWFYEVWTQPDAGRAEMSFFRNYVMSSWFSKTHGLDIDAAMNDDGLAKKLTFDRLDSRIHRVMYRLGSASPSDQFHLKAFYSKLNEADNVEDFMKWLNLDMGMIVDGAPLLPWMDDTAEFDAERAGGGWSSKLSTPTLMENINSLRSTARRMIKDIDNGAGRTEKDLKTARAIERWYKHLQNPGDVSLMASQEDRAEYERFVQLLERSANRRMTNGPRAMLQHTSHLAFGMYATAHAKGANPDQMAANAALEAADNAIGFLITAERVLGDLTAHNEDAVAQAPHMILRGGGRMMDRDGSPVAWQMNAVEAMLPLITKAENHSMMRAVLFDTVVELDNDGAARRKFLMGSTLDEVMRGNTVKDLFPKTDGKKPNLTQSMKYLVKMEQELRDTEKHVIQQKVTELVLERTTALDHTASFEEIQSMTVQAYLDYADILQVIGRTQARDGQDDPILVAHESLHEAAAVASIAATYNIDASVLSGEFKNLRPIVEKQILLPHMDKVEYLTKQLLDKTLSATTRDQVRKALKAEKKVLAGMQAKVKRMFDLNVTESIVAQYSYSDELPDDAKRARQTELMYYVYEHGELMQGAGPALVSVQAIMQHFEENPRRRKVDPLEMTDKDWETLSNVIISVEIQHLLTVGPASKPPPPYPGALKDGVKGLDKSKYWDHSRSFLFDFMSPGDTSGIVAAARKLAVDGGRVQSEFNAEEVAKKVADVLFREGSLGPWSGAIVAQHLESYELLTGASANPSISMHGLLSRRWGAAMQATERQYLTDTVADATVTLTPDDLNWMKNGQFHDVELTAGNGKKRKRPLAWFNNRFAEELSVTYTDPSGQPVPVDLMARPNVARTWLPARGTSPASRFKEVNITRLRDELELLLKQAHPQADANQLAAMFNSAQVYMRFVNPDAQPALTAEEAAAHSNSVWHEGTVFESAGDVGKSLLEELFFGPGGLNPLGQQAALDTRKLGLMGIEDYQRPDPEEVELVERLAGTDFGKMLAEKTRIMMDTPISNGKPINVHFFNAVYKLMKLKHWVEGTDTDGKRVRWSAEQVIAWQQANPDKDFFGDESPLRDARLWIPSDQVLADMLGDIGYGGVRGRALKRGVNIDLTTIAPYSALWTEDMERKFSIATSQPKTIMETDVARQSFVQDLKVSSYATPEERMRFQRRVEAMNRQRERALHERTTNAQRTTFDPAKNLEKNMGLATGWIAQGDVAIDFTGPLAYLRREHGDMLESTLVDLQRYVDDLRANRNGTLGTSFWIFQEAGLSAVEEGRLIKDSLSGQLNLVPGEVVFFDTSPYADMDPTEARKLALERIDYFVSQNVALMIGASKGPNTLTGELQGMVQELHSYKRYENNTNILVPDVFDESSYQNVAAARDRLVNPGDVPVYRQRLVGLLSDREVEENTMLVPIVEGERSKFESIQVVFDLFPIDVHSQFNTTVTEDDAERVHRRLLGLGDEGVEMLRNEVLGDLKGAERDKASDDFTAAWDNLMEQMPARVAAGTTGPLVGEKFGTGDIVPLLHKDTGELLLYRHGYKYPKADDFERQLKNQTRGATGERGIVIYRGKREASATTHRGYVSSIESSPGRGFRLELEIPIKDLGAKVTFDVNGMKYMLTDLPAKIRVPALKLFGNVGIDGYASLHDVISKQATGGLVASFQEAFTVFGMDFTEDIRSFFGEKNTADAITLLKKLAAYGQKHPIEEIYQLQSLLAGTDAYTATIMSILPQLEASGIDSSTWRERIADDTAEAHIARAMMLYLMTPGSNVNAVLQTSGFYVDNPTMAGAVSTRMPEMFTRSFDMAPPGSQVRVELEKRLNDKLARDGVEGWYLNTNTWELIGRPAGGDPIRMMLQYGEAHVTDDNLLLNLQAQERKDSQSTTRHQALMNMIGTGGVTRVDRKTEKKLARLTPMRQEDLEGDQSGRLWRDLTFVDPTTHGPGARWQRRTPAEHRFYDRSIRRMTQYRHAIDLSDEVFSDDRPAIDNAVNSIRTRLGLRKSQEELIHYWVRQVLYHPAEGSDQLAFGDDLSPKDVLGALRTILGNLDRGYLPTYDGAGPSFFSYHDLQILFHAYQRDESKWAPWRKQGDPRSKLGKDSIGDWISVAFGQALSEEVDFDPIYRLDFSGFMNTYQTVLKNSGYMMDITFDKEMQGRLLDPKTNEMLSVTIDPVEETRLNQVMLAATADLEYEDLMRGAASSEDPNQRAQAAAWRARRLKSRARWRARHKVRPVKVRSNRDFARNGIEHINKDADMHSLQRIVIALRHGMAMLNPGLYFSMIPEQGFRMYLSEASNLLSGESTIRSASALQRGIGRATGGRIELAQYSAQQVRDLNTLFKSMGNDGAFTSLIISDMMWHREKDSPGKVVNAFEKFASIGNKWQDPTWGTTQKSLARHYVEAIMRSIESMPTRYAFTTDSVIAALRTDPAYFATHYPELHQMASNFVVDFRSLKNTPWSLAMKSLYEPWATSDNSLKRFAGTLLKLQGMYATYNMNVLTTMTGMQGYTAMASVFLDGAKKPGSLMRLFMKARNGQPITDEDYESFDMSSCIDGVTIANAFIRGGVTQTGLFMLGMVSGGVLSGEDDEAKRRRRLADAMNAHLIMDPRRLEADFRNKDVIFMDWLPPQLSAFFRVQGDDGNGVDGEGQGARAAVQMSWLMKPFLSPILGMERFFMTGDFGYVTAGFGDAISSLPLFNKGKWDDAVRTAHELTAMAADESQAGTPTALKNSLYLATSAVAVYENMLLENMFVNSLYAGFDMYDRDPSRLVLRDSDGTPQVDIENNNRPNDLAVQEYTDKNTGDIGTGYKKRDPLTANLAAVTENNFTAAAMLSLFTGFKKDLMRSEMPVAVRTVKLPELTDNEAKAAVLLATSAQQAADGKLERRYSLDEITASLKKQFMEKKDWDSYNNLDAIAAKVYNSPQNPVDDPLSIIGPDGQEELTKSGHAALFKGLMNGTITLDDPEMRGIGITIEQRKELEAEFFSDYTRQGIDWGLTRDQAEKRATRLMYGPREDKTILGFSDILNDKRIPVSADAKYKQLNTTYVTGPDGFPWATGYKRGGAPGMGGFWQLFGGVKRPTIGMSDAIIQDGRMNSSDTIRNIDTGMRGLVPMHPSEEIPTEAEQTKSIIDAIKASGGSDYQGYVPNSGGGNGYGGGFYRGGGGYSGGGGGGYSPTIYWSRQPTLPRGTNVYGNSVKNIFWNNANIRRTTIRRERYQASRGRLNQWQ